MTVHITYYLFTLYSPNPDDYVSTFSPLIWRDVGESKHHSESFKLFSSKRFGEDVCNLLISGTMTEMDCFGLNMMSDQMIFSIDVIRWYLVLICFVRSWNFGFLANFIAEVLSIMSRVDCTCFTCKSSRIFLSHTISFVASAAATYSAFVVESHIISWSWYPSFFVSIEVWIRVSNQAEVVHLCILDSKVLSSLQVP